MARYKIKKGDINLFQKPNNGEGDSSLRQPSYDKDLVKSQIQEKDSPHNDNNVTSSSTEPKTSEVKNEVDKNTEIPDHTTEEHLENDTTNEENQNKPIEANQEPNDSLENKKEPKKQKENEPDSNNQESGSKNKENSGNRKNQKEPDNKQPEKPSNKKNDVNKDKSNKSPDKNGEGKNLGKNVGKKAGKNAGRKAGKKFNPKTASSSLSKAKGVKGTSKTVGKIASAGAKKGGALLKKAIAFLMKKAGAVAIKGIAFVASLLGGKGCLIIGAILGIVGLILVLIIAAYMMVFSIFADDNERQRNTVSSSGNVACVGGYVDEGSVVDYWDEQTSGTPLHGQANTMMEHAEEYNINPAIYMAIVAHETGWGNSHHAVNGNNFGGIKHFGNYPAIGDTAFRAYETPEEGLEAVADLLDRGYFSQGLTTIPDIQKKYAPLDDSIDTGGLNANWTSVVTTISEDLGGTEMNCGVGVLDQDAIYFPELGLASPLPIDFLVNNMTFGICGQHTSCYGGHDGVDFAYTGSFSEQKSLSEQTPLSSMVDGQVYFATSHFENHDSRLSNPFGVDNMGNQIHIHPDSDPQDTLEYAHISPGHPIEAGDSVVKGQYVGNIGHNGKSTSYHAHIGWLIDSNWSVSSARDWYTPMLNAINNDEYEVVEAEEENDDTQSASNEDDSESQPPADEKGSGGASPMMETDDKEIITKNGVAYIDDIVYVNTENPLPESFNSEKNELTTDTQESLNSMKADYNKEHKDDSLIVVSGFKSYEDQEKIYESYVDRLGEEEADRYVSKPGKSEHQTGEAVDILSQSEENKGLTTEFGGSEAGQWIENNAHKYGFILRYPNGKTSITQNRYEPWHLRYVGEEKAENIYESNMTLEEYYELD